MGLTFRVVWLVPFLGLPAACATELEPGLGSLPDASFSFGGSEGGAFGEAAGGEDFGAGGAVEASGGYVEFGSGGEDMSSGGAMMECMPPQKRCGGICVNPSPLIGCAVSGCTPCPDPPANSEARCDGEECSYECVEGYSDLGGSCVEMSGAGGSNFDPTAGAGGRAEGAGGRATGGPRQGGNCDIASCPACNIAGPLKCCTVLGTCGCSWVPGAYCL